jgi:hypothetical protein
MDVVNNPSHYQGEIECIECIKASMSKEQFIGYLKGNIIKYTWRFDRKNKSEDVKKLQVYAQWLENELIVK